MIAIRLLLVATCLAAAGVAGANLITPPPRVGCPEAPSHAFDFWIGEWSVSNPAGAVVGHSRIESTLDGCALAEHWNGAGGNVGTSYNAYDARAKVWRQFWVDSQGTVLRLQGNPLDGRMILQSEPARHLDRITWTPMDGRVRQVWEVSEDGGKHWMTSFDGSYSRSC